MQNANRPSRVLRALACGLATALLAAPLYAQAPPEHVALENVRIIPVSGPEIENGTVLISRGKIAAVGADVEVPFDARVFDLRGHVVMPGLINVHTAEGMDISNEPRPVTPHLDVYDAIDPSRLFFEDSLREGVAAIHVIPGNNTVIGGLGRVVHPIGRNPDEMTIQPGEFLKISISPRGGYDRMLQLATLRETFQKHADYLLKLAEQRYEEQRKEDEKPVDVTPAEAAKRGLDLIRAEDVDDENRNLLRLTGGQVNLPDQEGPKLFEPIGAFVYCGAAMDVAPAVKLAKDNGFFDRLVLVLGGECYKAVDELKAAARPVVLPPDLTYTETDPITGEVRETFVPKAIAKAGLLWALVPGPDDSLPERLLTYEAARCVRHGISRDDAIRAITINPAKMLNLADRLGTIEPGKDANLTVFTGDPLDFNSFVEMVFVNGIPAYERSKDERIQRMLTAEPDSAEPPQAAEPEAVPAEPAPVSQPAEPAPTSHPDQPSEPPAETNP